MERMKAEAMVDIFQFIKAIRIQRAGLVTTQVCNILMAHYYIAFAEPVIVIKEEESVQ